jgi:PAS domain S-box-containing protein
MMHEFHFPNKKTVLQILVWIGISLFLFKVSHQNYLLFHGSVEIFSIVIACGIFIVAWNSRKNIDNNYLLFLGIAYLFIGSFDLLHTFTYKGMGIIPGISANIPTQLWIAARFFESTVLFIAPFFLKKSLHVEYVLGLLGSISLIIILSIFTWGIFPDCFIDGHGLTPFKKNSEYLIASILFGAMLLLLNKRDEFDSNVLLLMVWAIICKIVSELAFTVYIDVYGFANFVGHIGKVISSYLVYRALIKIGLTEPYNLLYRSLKQSEERFRMLTTMSPSGIYLTDADSNFLYANNSWCEMAGLPVEQAASQGWLKALHPDDHERVSEAWQQMVTSQERLALEYRFQDKKGRTTWVYGQAKPLQDEAGTIIGYIGTNTNITERKIAEEKLWKFNKKIKFLSYSISHDLKNPANTLQGLTKLLLKKYKDQLDEKGREFCSHILGLSEQIVVLVQRINTYISTKENPLVLAKFSLDEITVAVKEEFSARVAARQVALVIQKDLPMIRADRLSLVRVIRNFVDNALKYGGPELRNIELRYEETSGHHIIAVADDGVGLKNKDPQEIFGEFKRADTAAGVKGSGLGLAIVKEIAKQHGGDAWMKTNPNRGITFNFSISKDI